MLRGYPIRFARDESGSLQASCPALPEMAAYGEDTSVAALRAVDAIEEALAGRIAAWQDAPAPRPRIKGDRGFAALPMQTILKIELYRVVRAAGVTRAELQRRLGWHREQVDRLFRLDHASRLDQMEAAFNAAGADLDLTVHMRESAATERRP
ncbi:MAG: type II toxin-antitoxin system HicB family antitoxin [Hyphomicrobiales bacterium]|nr:type II toxin-antitoxin system HicB family antitoxin [Hyphomicrobiales bacterium]